MEAASASEKKQTWYATLVAALEEQPRRSGAALPDPSQLWPSLEKEFSDPEARCQMAWCREDHLFDGKPSARYFPATHPGVKFSGVWYHSGKGLPYSGHENGVNRVFGLRSDQPGSKVELEFVGSRVVLLHKYGQVRSWNQELRPEEETLFGFASIEIDGQPARGAALSQGLRGEAVLDSSGNEGHSLLAEDLPFGPHRVTVTLQDRKRPPAQRSTLSVIGFEVGLSHQASTNLWREPARRCAVGVRQGEAWLRDAGKMANEAHDAATFLPLLRLYLASRTLEQEAVPLHALKAASRETMTALDNAAGSPPPETWTYRDRIGAMRARADAILQKAERFEHPAHSAPPWTALLAEVRAMAGLWEKMRAEQIRALPPILYVVRHPFTDVNATGNYHCECQPKAWGCAIRLYDPAQPEAMPRTVFSDPDGSIFDLSLSFDARTIFFSYRNRQSWKYWHIYEIGIDGKNLRRISGGPHYNFSPFELPEGRLGFISSRAMGTHLVCQPGPSTHLHRMNRDGSGVVDLSANTLADFTASLLPDGRVIYSRWEYVDSDLSYRNALWTQRPDGSGVQLYFGNTVFDPATFYQPRAIPGRDAVVCVLTAHHRIPHGAIGIVSSRSGLEAPRGVGFHWITEEFPSIEDRAIYWSYADPYPVSPHQFLAAYGGGPPNRFRICLLDESGNRIPVVEDPAMSCFNPLPVVVRHRAPSVATAVPEEAPPPRTLGKEALEIGAFLMADVYQGLEPAVRRGQVKRIRVMEQLPKTVSTHEPRAYGQGPLMSAGTYYAKRCWGEVPVESDGSAHFEAPAGKEIYFQALDADGQSIRSMTSATLLMPGEVQGCGGCHESRSHAPSPGAPLPLAFQRPPTPLRFPEWGNGGVLDYNKLVQPVWDQYCLRCHGGRNPAAGLDLCGDRTRFFNISYDNLIIRSQSDQVTTARFLGDESEKPLVHFHDMFTGLIKPLPPWATGSHQSRLLDYLDPKHCEQIIPPDQRRRVYLWIDSLIAYYPTTDHARPQSSGGRDAWARPGSAELADWFVKGFRPVYQRRCVGCHGDLGNEPGLKEWTGKYAWINLARPELSAALTAHLDKKAGGRGLSEKDFGHLLRAKWTERQSNYEGRWLTAQEHYKTMARALQAGAKPPSFTDPNDPDLVTMRQAIQEGKWLLEANPRADMPGFVSQSDRLAFDGRRRSMKITLASEAFPSASHCNPGDTLSGLNDQLEPTHSADENIPRFTWWDHRGTPEWVQYDFDRSHLVSETEVYWWDERRVGRLCRVPHSWRLLYKSGDGWKPVPHPSAYGAETDQFNRVRFDPVETTALRIEVQLQPAWSGGILEWRAR